MVTGWPDGKAARSWSAIGQDFPLTAHFHAGLTPGHYALVAKVPNPVHPDPDNPDMSMLVQFSVTPFADLAGAWSNPGIHHLQRVSETAELAVCRLKQPKSCPKAYRTSVA